MKICAIVAEYNPFHNGHARLVNFAKQNSDAVVAIMSGNFTQRGMPACADKYTRATHAVQCGVDLVIELPTIFAISSAQNFATASTQIAGIIDADTLCFGSECGDIDLLKKCALSLLEGKHDTALKTALKQGVSYPKAVESALPQYKQILQKPNNTLAIEYIKALLLQKISARPITMTRQDNYNLTTPTDGFASASAIRTMDKRVAIQYAPQFVIDSISQIAENNYKQYSATLLSTLTAKQLEHIEGISEGLENKFAKCMPTNDYDNLIQQVKSKRYTQLKLQRIILNTVLGITKDIVNQSKAIIPPLNVLAVNKNRTDLLEHIAKVASSESTNTQILDDITDKADRLYKALANINYKNYLQKI